MSTPTLERRSRHVVVNFGGGVNSSGLLIEAWRRGRRPDAVVFADTGSEMPHTYEHLEKMNVWLASSGVDFPKIEIVRWIRKQDSRPKRRADGSLGPQRDVKAGDFVTIEQQCLDGSELPSKAYGLSGCTSKWKQQPADEFVEALYPNDVTVERWIGFDADEPHRFDRMFAKNPQPRSTRVRNVSWSWRAPLVEWDMGRDECARAIAGVGMSVPRKSACFFCPSSKKKDVLYLRDHHPDLLTRALAMEDKARPNLETIKGLGRSVFSWRGFLESDVARKGLPIIEETAGGDTSCGCYDDSGDE